MEKENIKLIILVTKIIIESSLISLAIAVASYNLIGGLSSAISGFIATFALCIYIIPIMDYFAMEIEKHFKKETFK